MSNEHHHEEEGDDGAGGGIFDALDAAEEEEDIVVDASNKEMNDSNKTVYRVPVNLYKDDKRGEQFFYLQKGTFPNRSITDLKIIYTPKEKDQVREQVLADKNCPQVLLKNVKVECFLGDVISSDLEEDPNMDYLNDESFRLSGSKISAIRMRMYAQQKMQAQKQLEDPKCSNITLYLDIECRLGNREASQ